MHQAEIDAVMMRRCIALSARATHTGELPIACLICEGNRVVVETTNRVRQDGDVTRHAELIAISRAQMLEKRKNLSDCTLYSTLEPCPMCSFSIREVGISRIVFAIGSPLMGGFSKWNILRDTQISETIPEVFGPVPEVISGLLWREATEVWWAWNPIVWGFIEHRKIFSAAPAMERGEFMPSVGVPHNWFRSLFMSSKK